MALTEISQVPSASRSRTAAIEPSPVPPRNTFADQHLTRRHTPSKHIDNSTNADKENQTETSLNKDGGLKHPSKSLVITAQKGYPTTDANDSSYVKEPKTPSTPVKKSFLKNSTKKLMNLAFLSPTPETSHRSNPKPRDPEANEICEYKGPELHKTFKEASTWDEIFRAIQNSKHADLSKTDGEGRNPLHLLGLNTHLPETFGDRSIYGHIGKLVEKIRRKNCVKWLTSQDNAGCIPFEYEVKAWIEDLDIKPQEENKAHSIEIENKQEDIEASAGMETHESQNSLLQIEMPTQVIYAIHLASQILDALSSENSEDVVDLEDDVGDVPHIFFKGKLSRYPSDSTLLSNWKDTTRDFVGKFAKMDNLIKTLLFLNDEHRKCAFKCSLVRRIMTRKESIDKMWLLHMFQDADNNVSARATEYITLLSELVVGDGEMTPDGKEIVQKLEGMRGLMQSMLMLDKKMIEEVSSTPIVTKGKNW